MSRITDEHQNPIEVEDEQTPVETETLDDDNYDDENKLLRHNLRLRDQPRHRRGRYYRRSGCPALCLGRHRIRLPPAR